MQKSYNNSTPKIVGGVVLTSIVCIGLYFVLINMNSNNSTNAGTLSSDSPSTTQQQSDATTTTSNYYQNSNNNTSTSTSSFKDGQYSKTAYYYVPEGDQNSITVKVTISNSKVSSLEDSTSYRSRESSYYNDSFDNSIKGKVVGKSLDQISLSGVGGASLTTEAFMQALSEISTAAKS